MYSLLEEKERSSDAPLSSFAVDVAKHDREDRTRLVGGVLVNTRGERELRKVRRYESRKNTTT